VFVAARFPGTGMPETTNDPGSILDFPSCILHCKHHLKKLKADHFHFQKGQFNCSFAYITITPRSSRQQQSLAALGIHPGFNEHLPSTRLSISSEAFVFS
jgi:hypothetical protein